MNTPKVLILEDSIERQEQFKKNFQNAELVFTTTVEETIEQLKSKKWNALFLDHDLGGKVFVAPGSEPTGTDVARFLHINHQFQPKHIVVHSLNESGRKSICSLIRAQEVPFVWTMQIDFSTMRD